MRNLKKILALVLALVMSLSLMATASAAEATSANADPYATAEEVLKGLDVFKGDAGTGDYRFNETISRSETAALIYRIATGDVKDTQAAIYTNHPFTDVVANHWATGYISYCYNAEYVKGNGDGTFSPDSKVTGYATLAMILRAMGYGKNGEFEGDGWEIRTASTAKQIGILDKISDAQLGGDAPRSLVAQILFRALLTETAEFDARMPYQYPTTGETLGYKQFGLEEIQGVVTANEYADLYGDSTLADGKTRLNVNGADYTLNDTTTTLDDIGENCTAYVVPAGSNGSSKVLALDNDSTDYPETFDEVSLTKFLSDNGVKTNDDTETFVNFGYDTTWTSDWKVKYVIDIANFTTDDNTTPTDAKLNQFISDTFSYYGARGFSFYLPTTVKDTNGDWQYALQNTGKNATTGKYEWTLTYTVEFRINEDITTAHQNNIEEIFNVADKWYDTPYGYITGEVYVGTTSLKDVSDELSFNQFMDKYIKEDTEKSVSGNENGNWLKVIDNDGDGIAEYVLKTVYSVAQVASVKDDVVTLDVKNHDLKFDTWQNPGTYKVCGNDAVNTLTTQDVVSSDDLASLDVVYYAVIDGKAQTYKIEPITAKIEKVDHNALTATTTTGDMYTQAGVHEHIEDEAYMHFVRNLSGNVNYDLYLVNDYLAAFVKTDVAGQFVLITDGWFNQKINEKEYAIKIWDDENNKQSDPIIISAPNATLFVGEGVNNTILNNNWGALKYFGAGRDLNADLEDEQNKVHTIIAAVDQETGLIVPVENSSVTGRYQNNILDLHYTDADGKLYQKLPTMAAATGIVYRTAESSSTTTAYNQRGAAYDVRALNDTVYYTVVSDGATGAKVVAKAVGYANAPDLTSTAYAGNVEDIYAVGTLHRPDNNLNNGENYYVASIVVIEVNSWSESDELIFVVDDTMRYSNVYFRDLQVIRASGKLENITVDFSGYTGGYWDNVDNHKRVQPGFYKMYPTGVKDSDGKEIWRIRNNVASRDQQQDSTYIARPLTAAELAKLNVAAGQVNLVEQFGSKNYLVTRNWIAGKTVFSASTDGNWTGNGENGLNGWSWTWSSGSKYALQPDQRTDNYSEAAMGKNGAYTNEGRYEIGAETPLYTLAYGESWRYNTVSLGQYTGADWSTVFAARMDETTSAYHPGREDVKYYNNDGVQQNGTWFNNNDVVVVYNGSKIVYAISFANLRDSVGNWDDAQNIWLNSVPAANVTATIPTAEPVVTLTKGETALKDLGTVTTNALTNTTTVDILYSDWSKWAADESWTVTPGNNGNLIAIENKTTFSKDAQVVAQTAKPGTQTITVYTQGTKGTDGNVVVTEAYTYVINYLPSVTDFGDLISIDPTLLQVTGGVAPNYTSTSLTFKDAEKLTFQSMEDLLTTKLGAKVTVTAKDELGNPVDKAKDQTVNTAYAFDLTLELNGETTVIRNVTVSGTITGTYVTLTLGEGIEAYLSTNTWDELNARTPVPAYNNKIVVASGSALWFTYKGEGSFSATPSQTIYNFTSPGAPAWVADEGYTLAGQTSFSANATINFNKVTPVDASITAVDVPADMQQRLGAKVESVTVSDDNASATINISLPAGATAITNAASFGINQWLTVTGTTPVAGTAVTGTAPDGYASQMIVTYAGAGGGDPATLTVNFKVRDTKSYIVNIQGGKGNNATETGNINIAFFDVGKQAWVTPADGLEDLAKSANLQLKLGTVQVGMSYLSLMTGTFADTYSGVSGTDGAKFNMTMSQFADDVVCVYRNGVYQSGTTAVELTSGVIDILTFNADLNYDFTK